jgi:CheY-like chemotaxis protein
MNAETLSHMFEPFFTTKKEGRGTGLGLATVYGIVRQNDGHVTVSSNPGRGTTFKIYLPRIGDSVAPMTTEAPPIVYETILLVEDEQAVRVLMGEILEAAGYQVLEAATPEEALAHAGGHPGPIQLVVTDVILPRMSGREMAEALRPARPDTRVLYISGCTDDAVSRHGIPEAGVHFLQKPFTSDDLLHKIRDVLDAH